MPIGVSSDMCSPSSSGFSIPPHLVGIRDRVLRFIEDRVYPAEAILHARTPESVMKLKELQAEAKAAGLWALGHPKEARIALIINTHC